MALAEIAWNRFGLGARGDAVPPADPRRWLVDQFDRWNPRPPALGGIATSGVAGQAVAQARSELRMVRQERRAAMTDAAAMPMAADPPDNCAAQIRRGVRQFYLDGVAARTAAAVASDTPFVERLTHFWSNHFAVSADKLEVTGLAAAFEFDAIRPHVLGRFHDLLLAVEHHPAMLLYLDQAQSVGPDSPFGQRRMGGRAGLNENLAREILELHTLGVRTGYAQADVTELARALTGWTVAGLGRGGPRIVPRQPGEAVFAPALHQPGGRQILGKRYAEGGAGQSAAVLADLAVHPATAKHIATKLVRHFIADDPPPAAVARVEQAFLSSRGDLPTVYRALVAAPEGWTTAPAKFRTPWEWTVATLRAIDAPATEGRGLVNLFAQLGQPIWRPGQPIGFDDIAASWAGPDALMRRVEAAERLVGRLREPPDPRALATRLFPDSLASATAAAIARAESPAQGLALLFVAPQFLRR
ncbi:DUF1800 domain-containing protein [Sphingomonas sp. ABOLH]|uniref:DUF1800 domain-containing protein n=1 Tax=Sphingomonas sp. ABOLH TaxID=1985881 RepID=UPI000F7E8C59|nr:DUF1800 domain-containing protein [Sphingomonas sp. ABOLH]RSV33680.1 DUF1800 domain-containing protein [Sphingomonas sp. ABOLH]